MNCKNCKHWRRGGYLMTEYYKNVSKHDTAELVGIGHEGKPIYSVTIPDATCGLCLHPSMQSDCINSWFDRVSEGVPVDGVFAGCDEDRGFLGTGQDFGCIHFEANP